MECLYRLIDFALGFIGLSQDGEKLAPFHSTCEYGFTQVCITHDLGGVLCAPRTFCEEKESLATHGGVGKLLQRTQQGGDDLITAILSEEHGLDERYMGTLDWRGSCVKQSRQQALRFVKQAKPDIACYQGV
jgi:hypothetical protein